MDHSVKSNRQKEGCVWGVGGLRRSVETANLIRRGEGDPSDYSWV